MTSKDGLAYIQENFGILRAAKRDSRPKALRQLKPFRGSDLRRKARELLLALFRLSWKWRKRSTVKITERTLEETKKALHRRRESRHPEAAFIGQGARFVAVCRAGATADRVV